MNRGLQYEGQSGADYSFHHDDEEDDKESVVDPPPLDKTYARLVNFIHNRFPHSQPSQLRMFLHGVSSRIFSLLMILLCQQNRILRSTPGLRS